MTDAQLLDPQTEEGAISFARGFVRSDAFMLLFPLCVCDLLPDGSRLPRSGAVPPGLQLRGLAYQQYALPQEPAQ